MGSLARYLNRESVALGATADDWRAAVELCGRLLVAGGAAEERYVPAMVATVEELGPYAVIAPGVAIPHARPEAGALGVGLSVTVLARPVAFGSRENDPVDVLFGFATPDADAHIELLGELADFIESGESLGALRRAGSVQEVEALFA